ncbi:hypothetical protein, partial [Candidatus Albibeggiatoa sp. nov. BB20]|uniref:hypothetical protein n=1 Tax=Candidatus Albibeggiatoa sp. nov. BB20 TaxID=3162723 RepID=UPI00336596CD
YPWTKLITVLSVMAASSLIHAVRIKMTEKIINKNRTRNFLASLDSLENIAVDIPLINHNSTWFG